MESGSLCQLRTEVVKASIRSKDLKLWWVAEFSGMHKTTLRRWLSGRVALVTTLRAKRLATILDMPLSMIAVPTARRVGVTNAS